MKELPFRGEVERKPPMILRTWLFANIIVPIIVDNRIGEGLSDEGHKLLKQVVVRVCKGRKVSVSQDVSLIYSGANLSIEVVGQENIPESGSTLIIANHTRGGPFFSVGQFFEMVKEANIARQKKDEEIKEPFVIMQRGVGQTKLIRHLSGIFYEMAGQSLNFEVVEIPKFDTDKDIISGQGIRHDAIERIISGEASLWTPQGTHRDADDFNFPEKKGTRFLQKINDRESDVQLVPVRSIPDESGNVKVVFGSAVDIGHVIENGGINYFSQNYIASLK